MTKILSILVATLKFIWIKLKATMDKLSFLEKKRVVKDNGNISFIIVKKVLSLKGKSSAKLKAASWSTLGWKLSCPVLKLIIRKSKIWTNLLATLSISKFLKSTWIEKISSFLEEKFSKKKGFLAKLRCLSTFMKAR